MDRSSILLSRTRMNRSKIFLGLCILIVFVFLHFNLAPKIYGEESPKILNGIKKMILVPSGNFIMGEKDNNFSDEKPEHVVTVKSFYMDETPITYKNFAKYVADGGNKTRYWQYESYNMEENPISGINWYQAVDYCNWRSEKENLTPAYKISNKLDAWGYQLWELDTSSNGYRLPTEAEFEYAARGGLEGKKFPWGDEFNPKFANYDDERGLMKGDWWRLAKVKDTPANNYGLYGMSGNVWQWTNDWYDKNYYATSNKDNPKGPDTGRTKVMRGGSWGSISPDYLRVSKRSAMAPSNYNYDVGFRCVRPTIEIKLDSSLKSDV